jgi:NAD(P)-dependent dehydrogenase (short-subunit alcohol dehydrogenase family)
MSKVWFITGAGRGMDVHIAKAALAAGNAVIATGITKETRPSDWVEGQFRKII